MKNFFIILAIVVLLIIVIAISASQKKKREQELALAEIEYANSTGSTLPQEEDQAKPGIRVIPSLLTGIPIPKNVFNKKTSKTTSSKTAFGRRSIPSSRKSNFLSNIKRPSLKNRKLALPFRRR